MSIIAYQKFKNLLLLLLVTIVSINMYAQSITGRIVDAATGEPLTGATIKISETNNKQIVQLDGKYLFKNLTYGSYTLKVSYVNYTSIEKKLVVAKGITIIDIALQSITKELSNVTVTASGISLDKNPRLLEKNANQLVNIISARTIELLPDITTANVLSRVSGVTIEKTNTGEARYPIIRGMEKRYINTLVNGIKIPSPDNKNRFIPLDLFPSELLERLEISKSLTPSMEGDAIGGTINLVMKDAPSSKIFQLNIAGGYNNIFSVQDYLHFDNSAMNKKSPAEINNANYIAKVSDFPIGSLNYTTKKSPLNFTLGFTIGNRFGKDKKLGLLFSGSLQNIFSGTQTTLFLNDAQPNLNNLPSFVTLSDRRYSVQNKRTGINAKADYKFNNSNKISWFNTFVRLDQLQTRLSYDTTALNSLVTANYRSIWQYQSIFNSTVQGVHQLLNGFDLDWSIGYSIANNHIPDQASFGHQYPVSNANFTDALQSMSRTWLHNSDNDFSSYINFTKKTTLFKQPFELKIGGMIRAKNRDNFYNSYTLNPLLPANASIQTYTTINAAQFTFTASNASPGLNGNNYNFKENVSAAYAQGKWMIGNNVELLGGVRMEYTNQNYSANVDSSVTARSGRIYYTDFLPSGQFKYILSKKQAIRVSYYRAIARPQFSELIPFGPDNYELYKEVGNPFTLKHSSSDNFDIRYELFPKSADQILIGVFYKQIQDPIEFTAVRVPPSSQILQPNNIGKATNYGFEAVLTKYIGTFGISANYTYTQSTVTNDSMLYYYRNTSGNIATKIVSETRPLQGQANNIGSVSLIYKNSKIGFDAQIAYVYTGERIVLLNPYAGLHYWQQPQSTIDISFEKKIAKRFAFYGKANNLTNEPLIQSIHVPYNTYIVSSGAKQLSAQTNPDNQIIVSKSFNKSSFLVGIRYKF